MISFIKYSIYTKHCSKASNDKNVLKGGLKDNGKTIAVESGKACRICLDDAEEEDNPFITPCKCAGSMRFIHLNCLKEWYDSCSLILCIGWTQRELHKNYKEYTLTTGKNYHVSCVKNHLH